MASEPTQPQRGATRVTLTVLVTMVVGLLVALEGPSPADVTGPVVASGYGYRAYGISRAGVSQPDTGPTPTASLPPDGLGSPQEGRAYTGTVAYEPARLFTSDDILVALTASLGAGGRVKADSDFENVGKSTRQPTGSEILTADRVHGQVVVDQTGIHAATTITNGTYDPAGIVAIPLNPALDSKVAGRVRLSDASSYDYVIVFNEQITNPDGSLTLNPVHEIFGATIDGSDNIVLDPPYAPGGSVLHGDLVLGQLTAGGTVTSTTSTTTTSTTATTSTTTASTTSTTASTTSTTPQGTTTSVPTTTVPPGGPPAAPPPSSACSLLSGLFGLPVVGPLLAFVARLPGCPD